MGVVGEVGSAQGFHKFGGSGSVLLRRNAREGGREGTRGLHSISDHAIPDQVLVKRHTAAWLLDQV